VAGLVGDSNTDAFWRLNVGLGVVGDAAGFFFTPSTVRTILGAMEARLGEACLNQKPFLTSATQALSQKLQRGLLVKYGQG
jgi:hypothetical protein